MPNGLLIVNGVLIFGGLISAFFVPKEYAFAVIMVPMLIAVMFNMSTGTTNSPDNIDSRFRRWLFKD